MKKYQRDSENALRRGIEPLKDKIKDDRQKREKLEKDIRALEDALRDLVAKNNALQGKVQLKTPAKPIHLAVRCILPYFVSFFSNSCPLFEQISGLEREREGLMKQNQCDRTKAEQTIKDLEQRIHQLMDQIMANSK